MKHSDEIRKQLDSLSQRMRDAGVLKESWNSACARDMSGFHGIELPSQEELDELDRKAEQHSKHPLVIEYRRLKSEYAGALSSEAQEARREQGRQYGWKQVMAGERGEMREWVPRNEYDGLQGGS